MSDPNGFLVSFLDGPLEGRGNLAGSGGHVFQLPATVWSWPLPERIAVLAHLEHTERVAMWNADGDGDGLPEEIWRSPNAVVYRKQGESQLPRGTTHVVRGATYKLERDG